MNRPIARRPAPVESQDRLVRSLCDWDAPCPSCGANLRGITAAVCPSCREQLGLSVGSAESVPQCWTAQVTALSISAAPGIMFLASIIRVGGIHPDLLKLPILPAALVHIASIPLVGATLLLRRRFLRSSVRWQRTMAIASVTMAALAMGVSLLCLD